MASWTQAEIEELERAIAAGVQSVTFSGPPSRTVTYQSAKDMRETLAQMRSELATAEQRRVSVRYASLRKGF